MATPSEPVAHVCGKCNNKATEYCGRCTKIWYCGRVCQAAHWQAHKQTCGTDKILQHAAEVYQKAWLAYREATFDIDVVKLEDQGNQLLLHIRKAGFRHGIAGFFFEFPAALVRNDEDKQALLTSMMCEDALAYLHEFFARMVKGSYDKIEEVDVRIKPSRRTTADCDSDRTSDGQTCPHLLLRATSKDGIVFAIDPTGAQNGQMKAWMPWQDFEDLYVERIVDIFPFGTFQDFSNIEAAKGEGAAGYISRVNWEAMKAFRQGIKTWEAASGLTSSRLVRKWDESFCSEVVKMQLSIIRALKAHIATKDYEEGNRAAYAWDAVNQGRRMTIARRNALFNEVSLLPKPQSLERDHTLHDSGIHEMKFPGFTLLDMGGGGAIEMLSEHMRDGMTSKEVWDLFMRTSGLGITPQ
ncbi:uncharacterized protein BDZ99DRAFT_430440 [Mytilinidion resinicola]|uniref:MYND-type domain-containing protein n=1 Tax=Mytilinidion resinicola TaxID=574789 RepID=A0A6A6Z7K9_9PEZI|nr:uncharacterized protein BDZ99DRAFT_430440 [Mytilinidion resinicola]KAF2816808.1 hypothetical protein BDZ99DRAFT_430440 [Mytilinidion resinicola]